MYMGDVGLLASRNNLTMENLLSDDRLFAGGLAENYVACQLKANGYKLYYWESNNRAVKASLRQYIGMLEELYMSI